jgi:hypothetical protein
MYTTPTAMKNRRLRFFSEASNSLAEPWKLVVTVGGSSCRAISLT